MRTGLLSPIGYPSAMSQPSSRHAQTRSHAGPRRGSNAPEVPEPSHAERARTLLHRQHIGYLSSHSQKLPGFPFGSVMPFALDAAGRPIFLISKMAMHTQNLDREPKASLLVPDAEAMADPLGAARVTLQGETTAVPDAELEAVRQLYLERHEKARYWVDYKDFGFYRMQVVGIYFVGGFGVMGWVEAGDFAAAEADPLVDAAAHIIEHMNDDHGDALILLASLDDGVREAETAVEEATMTAVDRLGFHLRLRMGERYRGCRIAFPQAVGNADETRRVLVDMVRRLRRQGKHAAE